MSEDLHLLIGAYAMDALDGAERELFEDHLTGCRSCSVELRGLTATTSALAVGASTIPPPRMRADVLGRLDLLRELPPATAPAPPLPMRRERRTFRLVAAFAAAAVVLATVGATWSTVRYRDAERREQIAVAQQRAVARVLAAPDATVLPPAEPEWSSSKVVMSPSLGEAVLVADGLTAPPPGKTYELWVIADGTPRPAGTFEPGAERALSRTLDASMDGAEVIAVAVEPDGGRPTPSGDPVATFSVPGA